MGAVYEALRAYAGGDVLRLHMPGHGGRSAALGALSPVLPLDVTEIPPTGDLLTGEGPFAAAYDRADRLYGGTTVFSAGGATLALQAALFLATRRGTKRKLLVDRRCHKSVLAAMVLLDLEPVWLYPEGDVLPLRTLEEAARAHPDAAAAVVVSPTYYGRLSELHTPLPNGVRLVVDNSHGSHLLLLGRHPFLAGADYVVDSLHKTLPALTGAALLHCRETREEALEALRLFGSTSPSFLIAASIDLCLDYLEGEGRADLIRQTETLRALRVRLAAHGVASLSGQEYDPARLTLFLPGGARALKEALEKRSIFAEFSDVDHLVLIPPLTFGEQAAARLEEAVTAALPLPSGEAEAALPPELPQALSPRAAYFSPRERLPLHLAAGRICAAPLYCYPPGIPLCVPGERLTDAFCSWASTRFDTVWVTRSS